MNQTNKILLKTILEIDLAIEDINSGFQSNAISLQLDFSKILDTFSVIIQAFPINSKYYEDLYDLLNNFYNHEISIFNVISGIEKFL